MTKLGLSPLGARLAAAFVAVALVTLALFATLTLRSDTGDVNSLARSSRSQTLSAVASAAASAYATAGGWSSADLQPVIALTNNADAAVEIQTSAGPIVLRSGDSSLLAAKNALRQTAPILSNSRVVGEVDLAFPAGGLTPAQRHLHSAVLRGAGIAAGFAVALALVASLLTTRLVVRPLRRLSEAVRSVGAGQQGVKIGPGLGVGELAELGSAFNAMAESLDAAEHLRQGMVADVAHELRTPLAVLQAETEALKDGIRLPDMAALSSLHEEALRLGRLVEDLQALASADATGFRIQGHTLDLAEVAAAAADSIETRFRSTDIRLERELKPTMVWGDAQRLNQVVTNLLANAAKYTPPGGRVQLVVGPKDGAARIEVTDSGPGIPDDERPLIFDRFYRGSSRRQAGGSGIGLAVVRQLVIAHGGDVGTESPSRRGGSFIVTLPLSTTPPAWRH